MMSSHSWIEFTKIRDELLVPFGVETQNAAISPNVRGNNATPFATINKPISP